MSWGISYPHVMKNFEKRCPEKENSLQSLSLKRKNKEIRAYVGIEKKKDKRDQH